MDCTNVTKKLNCSTCDYLDGKVWDDVKQYILSCPYAPSNHPAITSAMKGLDLEKKRQERDAKLRRKFSNSTSNVSENTNIKSFKNKIASEETVIVTPGFSHREKSRIGANDDRMVDENDEDDDWQDVNREIRKVPEDFKKTADFAVDSDKYVLGQKLSQTVISSLGFHNVRVQSPTAAIAVAFHAMLVCPEFQFVCTGIPENSCNSNSRTKGFAAPIRDIPRTQFLPSRWEIEYGTSTIMIRYRKIDESLSTRILNVAIAPQLVNNSTDLGNGPYVVEVRWTPSSFSSTASTSDERIPSALIFQLDEHFNTKSWTKAWSNSGPDGNRSTSPTLHYKHLHVLLTRFCQHFDLGIVYDNGTDVTSTPSPVADSVLYKDCTIQNLPTRIHGVVNPITTSTTTSATDAPILDPLRIPDVGGNNPFHPSLTGRVHGGGDFAGDLFHPGDCVNPVDPLGVLNPSGNIGNLLGPNHPLFIGPQPHQQQQQPWNDPAFSGFGGMKPRFDLYGPPPTNLDHDMDDGGCRNNGLPGSVMRSPPMKSFGPNPDHLNRPGFGNNDSNMFM